MPRSAVSLVSTIGRDYRDHCLPPAAARVSPPIVTYSQAVGQPDTQWAETMTRGAGGYNVTTGVYIRYCDDCAGRDTSTITRRMEAEPGTESAAGIQTDSQTMFCPGESAGVGNVISFY